MNFSWSTPLRQVGQTSLPLIPNEIYLAIFECIAPTSKPLLSRTIRTFSALSLVCRFFCAIALPRVFERVVLWGSTAEDGIHACRKTVWARQIVANTESAKSVALYVRECCFKYWFATEEVREGFLPLSTLYCQAMGCMTNIRKVMFHRSFVAKGHWETMATLKQLECLTFSDCSFIHNPPDQELSVRTVKLHNSPTPFVLRPIATSSLRTLETDTLDHILIVNIRQSAIESLTLLSRGLVASLLIDSFSLKKLLVSTRLRSFSMRAPLGDDNIIRYHIIPRHDTDKLISVICDGPGTLPSLEELDLLFVTNDELMTTLDIVSGRLKDTIIPAFPNLKCIRTPGGDLRLEKGGWSHMLYN